MPLNVRPLRADLRKIANEELNEDEKYLEEEIKIFREWISKQPHLKARTHDQFLLSFLRGSKHSLEKAKSKIDHYYTIKTMMPELFENLHLDIKNKSLWQSGSIFFISNPEILSPDICIIRFHENFNYKEHKLIDFLRYRNITLEYALNNSDKSMIMGYIDVIDLSKISLSFYAQTDFVMMKKLSVFVVKAIPTRLKAIHIINCPKKFLNILQFVKSITPEKYQKLFYVHESFEDLHKFISRECLPEEYGGTYGTIEEISRNITETYSSFNDYLVENEKYKVEEHLRISKEFNIQTLFGLEGTFRKLQID